MNEYQNHSCENCKNESICKFTDDFNNKKKKLDEFRGLPVSPVKIFMVCDAHETKPLNVRGGF